MEISVNRIVKHYGNFVALNDVSFRVRSGHITALLGKNGAGKTSLLHILATLLKPKSGTAFIGEHEVTRNAFDIRKMIGLLPQSFGLHNNLTVVEFLDYLGTLRGAVNLRQHLSEILEQVGLTEVATKRIHTLSGGMRQRVGIAQALLNDPPILLLDEPLVGLDPAERNRFRQLLIHLAHQRTIVLSTHLVEDISLAASNVIVLNKGSLCFEGTPKDLINTVVDKTWELVVPLQQFEFISPKVLITRVQNEGIQQRVRIITDDPEQMKYDIQSVEPTLEDAYLWLVREDHDEKYKKSSVD